MTINNGEIRQTVTDSQGREVVMSIFYDQTAPLDNQPLINGPRGWCLDLTNVSGRNVRIGVTLPNGTETVVQVGQGDPVTGGPVNGRSRTAAQMAALGFVKRTDIAGLSIG